MCPHSMKIERKIYLKLINIYNAYNVNLESSKQFNKKRLQFSQYYGTHTPLFIHNH